MSRIRSTRVTVGLVLLVVVLTSLATSAVVRAEHEHQGNGNNDEKQVSREVETDYTSHGPGIMETSKVSRYVSRDWSSSSSESDDTGIPHCVRLDAEGRMCAVCEIGYLRTSDGGCSQKGLCNVKNCAVCASQTPDECDMCAYGYETKDGGFSCTGAGPIQTWSVCSPWYFCRDLRRMLRASPSNTSLCICCRKTPNGDACESATYGYCRLPGCNICDSDGQCVDCASGYTATSDGACIKCDVANCASCVRPNTCGVCTKHYRVSKNRRECIPSDD